MQTDHPITAHPRRAHPRLFRAARALWLLIAAPAVGLMLLGTASLFRAVSSLNAPPAPGQPDQDFMDLAWQTIQTLGISPRTYAIFEAGVYLFVFGLFLLVAWLIYARKPDDASALLVATFLLFMGMTAGQTVIAFALARFTPQLVDRIIYVINSIGWTLFVAFLFLFPDGRPVPRWTRWLLLAWIVTFFFPERWYETGMQAVLLTAFSLAVVVIATAAQIYRYRRVSSYIEKQQTKWVTFGLALFIAGSLAMRPVINSGPTVPYLDIVVIGISILPITIGIAVLRAGLWNVDVVIRRTLVYTVLTVLLALAYFGSIALLQSIFTALSGQESALAIVISTLLIAALFSPLRRAVQDFIDRRFYRRKYDAQQVLAQFARAAQQETDHAVLTDRLTRVVQETVQPEHIHIWLRER